MERATGRAEGGGAQGAPRVSATVFRRPRLLERLDSWPDITVVHGPIGSGKTTLLASWVASLASPVLWCEPEAGALPFSELEAFAAAGAGVLVIDLGERADAAQFARLGSLIDRSPRLRVAVATRSTRTARELAAASDAALDVIGPADLLVTLDELRDADLLDGDDARLELLRRSEGLAVAVRAKIDDALGRTSGARERLRRLLRSELGAHGGRYEAALRVALLPRVDRAILAGWEIPDRFVDDLDEAGLAEWDDDWLRMHPYIRGVLAEDAEQQLPLVERRRLLAAAVRSSLVERDPLQGLRTAFELRDLGLATEVVFANMVELLEARDATYEVFQGIPPSDLRGYPGLTVLLALLSNMDPDTRPRALQLLATESIFQRLHPSRGLHRERVVYRAFEAAALRLTPFSGRALPLIRRAVEDFSALSDEDVDALGRMGPMLQVHLGIGAFYLRDLELARRCFEMADAKHIEAGRADRVDPLSMRAGLAALSGDLPLARRLLEEADAAEWPAGWRGSSPADFFNLGRAVLALEDGDPHAAEAHLDAAGPTVDIIEHWTLYALVRARRDRLAGEVEAGLMRVQRLREQRGAAPGTAMARSLLDAAEAELRLASGEAVTARRVAARSAKHSAVCRLVLARAELALDRTSEAAVHAQRVLGAPAATPRSRLEAELVLACSALRAGHPRDVEVFATRISELVRSTEVRAPLRTIAPRDREPLVDALLRAGVAEAITSLVAAEALPAEAEVEPLVALTPREQAVLEALVDAGTMDEIAARLFVSRNTVKSQLRNVYRKLGVSSREAALSRAALLGLLEEPAA
ncbi:hypothetical protein JD276_08145 [Leucobacter sp. CSA1]|uniref:HTH luxR-type domain-containing protein n=1 Tax=Leucobacter chromiisoli TaxID=2796471 RepID=A0A934Q9A2_9MICO|nr:LuxR C-terminal-related transcriptional regulator [Leucobacter chromiisoli]MBK0419004.1 hypothetical protein [Leucobacter chromiisoli]